MTREENVRAIIECCFSQTDKDIRETAIKNIVKSLQSENEFISSAEDYRLRLIQIFHNTHCEEFISFMVLPTESDLNMLEDMLREHYKDTVPCDDAISRDAFITRYKEWMRSERGKIPNDDTLAIRVIESLPSVTPTRNKAKWIMTGEFEELYCEMARCSSCGGKTINNGVDKFCPDCGAEMESEE